MPACWHLANENFRLFTIVKAYKGMTPRTKAEAILTPAHSGEDEASLLDILDHVLNAGVVLHGSVVISVAGVDLVYLGLNAVLTSVETALKHIERQHRDS